MEAHLLLEVARIKERICGSFLLHRVWRLITSAHSIFLKEIYYYWDSHPVANTPFFLAPVVGAHDHPRVLGFRAIQITPRTDLPLLFRRLVWSEPKPSSWCRFIPSSMWELVTLGTTRNHQIINDLIRMYCDHPASSYWLSLRIYLY